MSAIELSLPSIYKSLHANLEAIKFQLTEVQESMGTVQQIKQFVNRVLIPACRCTKTDTVPSYQSMKCLLERHKSAVNSSIAHTIVDGASTCWGCKTPPKTEQKKTQSLILPPVLPPHQTESKKPRPPSVRYPVIDPALTRSPTLTKGSPRIGSPLRKITPLSNAAHGISFEDSSSPLRASDVQEELDRHLEAAKRNTIKLQETFLRFSQRVMVPLKTFCKLSNQQTRPTRNTSAEPVKGKPQYAQHESEFIIDEIMQQIKSFLWPPQDGVHVPIFTHEGISYQISTLVDCDRFACVRILPDVLQKFSRVHTCATTWLKVDELFTEKAKRGYNRVNRRYNKTERMWREARQVHRQLASEYDRAGDQLQTNELRMETLQQDIELMKEDFDKTQDQRMVMVIKLRDNTNTVEFLRARHIALRKKINILERKIEARERNYEYMHSRILSMRTDHNAIKEKLRINEEFSSSLRDKMVQLFKDRDAWKRRYQDKTDPAILKRKLEQAGVRIPTPTVREKTFILKSKVDNLREAVGLIPEELQSRDWRVLCVNLPWPDSMLNSIRAADDHKSIPNGVSRTTLPPVRNFTAEQDNKSLYKIINYVELRNCSNERNKCSFMLNLWLRYSEKNACLDQLLDALRTSQMSDVANSIVQSCH